MSHISSPVRTCIACKRTDGPHQMLRLVRSIGVNGVASVAIDWRSRLAGRGAWLHPRQDCLNLAIKRRAIARALPGVTNVAEVELALEIAGRGHDTITEPINVPL